MIRAIVLFIILGLGLFVGSEYSGQQGYVLISIANKTIEMSVTTLVIMVVGLLIAIFALEFIVKKVLSSTFKTFNWFTIRKIRRSRRLTNEGIIKLIEGDFKQAEKKVIRWAKHHDNPLLCYLMASEAADNLGNIKKRDHYLALANEQNHAKLAVELTRAKQQVNDGHISLGLKTLQSLQPDAPNNPILLNLLKRCYITLHRWQPLIEILPKLRKFNHLTEAENRELLETAHVGVLADIAKRNNSHDLIEHWETLNRHDKKNAVITAAVARHLLNVSEGKEALPFITRVMKSSPSTQLYMLIAEVPQVHQQDAKKLLLRVLAKNAHNAEAHSAIAKLYEYQNNWSDAQFHLEQALSIRTSIADYSRLSEVLAQQNKTQAAQDVSRKALSLLPE
ncbi:heme biosynthesis HemY N-terminal domain-containing protein [Vibrio palustris]|uniref:Putative protoheme IX biogenesis protein n=1 Tax=Vibrio palustris TaxID=1918946 RepID=A0A1R4B827_9VIBR|nr:heme biosynthesis HemY N-terminal domain-containing protein [Vibrio palustris]SJL85072.1 putative protoheme IX biogenesis protein [Vibrio palustris]